MPLEPFRQFRSDDEAFRSPCLRHGLAYGGFKPFRGELAFLRVAYGHEPGVIGGEDMAVHLEGGAAGKSFEKQTGMFGDDGWHSVHLALKHSATMP